MISTVINKEPRMDEIQIMRLYKTYKEEVGDILEIVEDGWDFYDIRNMLMIAFTSVAEQHVDMAESIAETMWIK